LEDLIQAARVVKAAEQVMESLSVHAAAYNRVFAELAASRQAAEANTEKLRQFTARLANETLSTVD